jgi:hypothetical protein
MKNVRFRATAVLLAVVAVTTSSLVHAQATRTWVSGVGDDVNPCSRTAPCKTFAGAISKTSDGGEIDALDPGGYGTVTITKSITLDGGTGQGWASILSSGTNGIVISPSTNPAAVVVTLRNLSINGAGTGLNGIRILTGGTVFVENCQIFGHTSRGISDERTAASTLLFVDNTVVRDNTSSGIVILNAGSPVGVDASIRNSRIVGNGNSGIVAGSGARVSVLNSIASGNVNYGVYVEQLSSGTFISITDSAFHENTTGIQVGPGSPAIVMSDVSITNNGTGMSLAGANVYSFGNNKIGGNFAGNSGFNLNGLPLQ